MTIFFDNFWWQFLMTIFDDNLWWQSLMTIFDDNFWWQFLMTFLTIIFDDNFLWQFLWQFLMTLFDDNFLWQFLMTFFESCCDMRLDTWDTDYISDNWEQQYEQLHCDLWIQSDGDSIRNSCDVLKTYSNNLDQKRQNHTSFFCLDFSTLRFQMSPQMLCPRRGKVTLAALVWFFSTVYFQMSPQSASIRGCKVTLVAFV